MAGLSLRSVNKSFGEVEVVHGVDLEIADREFVVFVGPSGCGKSTLLRMIAGLEDITSGEIAIDGRVVNELDPKDRDIAMVFQDYALYPHMTVFENMAFSLRYRGVDRQEIRRRVDEAARILDIEPYIARMPRQLSGGQRQRVAMGRAIVRDPKVFLFDEPLSQPRRQAARADAHRDQAAARARRHDHDLRHPRPGRGDDAGRPHRHPEPRPHRADRHARGRLRPAGLDLRRGLHRRAADEPAAGRRRCPPPAAPSARRAGGRAARASRLARRRWARRCSSGTASVVEPLGSDTLVSLEVGGTAVIARLPPRLVRRKGEAVGLAADPANMHFFDKATGLRQTTRTPSVARGL